MAWPHDQIECPGCGERLLNCCLEMENRGEDGKILCCHCYSTLWIVRLEEKFNNED